MSNGIDRPLSDNSWEAAENANAPSAGNPFATMADVGAGAGDLPAVLTAGDTGNVGQNVNLRSGRFDTTNNGTTGGPSSTLSRIRMYTATLPGQESYVEVITDRPTLVHDLIVRATTLGSYVKLESGIVGGNAGFKAIGNGEATFLATLSGTDRTYTFKDASGTLAFVSDILAAASVAQINTGTNNAVSATPLGLQGSKYLDQSGAKIGATAAGTNTYTATISPAITAYVDTQRFFIKFTNGNTGASTLNLNGLGAKSIVKNGNIPLTIGDIMAGQILCLAYDGTNFQLVGGIGTDHTIYRQGIDGAFIPGYAGTAGTYAYVGGLSTSVHLGSGGNNQQATRTYHFKLPDDFVAFKSIKVGTYRFGTVDSFTVRLVKAPTYPYAAGTTGTTDSTINGLNVNPTANDTHEERTFVPGSSYAAGDTVAVMFDDQVDNGVYAEISFVDLNYYSK